LLLQSVIYYLYLLHGAAVGYGICPSFPRVRLSYWKYNLNYFALKWPNFRDRGKNEATSHVVTAERCKISTVLFARLRSSLRDFGCFRILTRQ